MIQRTVSGTNQKKLFSENFSLFNSINFPFNFSFHSFFTFSFLFYCFQSLHANYSSICSDFYTETFSLDFLHKTKTHLNTKKTKRSSLVFLYPTRENRLITVSRRSQLIMEWMKSFLAPQPPVLCCVENNSETVYCTARNDWAGGDVGSKRDRAEKVSPHNHHCVVIAVSQTTKKKLMCFRLLKYSQKFNAVYV